MSLRAYACLVALVLTGCASYSGYGLRPGVSTEPDIRSAMGAPALEFSGADGSRSLVYPRGPLGTQTYIAAVRPDGTLLSIDQVLGDETFQRIQPGMTRDEILRMIGPPGDTMAFSRLRQVAWDYRFVDTWGYLAIFSVSFDENGVVVSKFTRRVERDRRP